MAVPQPSRAEILIDTRPLWRILAERTYRPIVLSVGLAAYLAIRAMPAPEGLSPAGQKALAPVHRKRFRSPTGSIGGATSPRRSKPP